jgi:hypothetical protein
MWSELLKLQPQTGEQIPADVLVQYFSDFYIQSGVFL